MKLKRKLKRYYGRSRSNLRHLLLYLANIRIDRVHRYRKIPLSFLGDFDMESYLFANPDVAIAVESGRVKSALEHFLLFGYDEVRMGKRRIGNAFPEFSEESYLRENPDVERAVRDRRFSSAFMHFLTFGYREYLDGKPRRVSGDFPFEMSDELKERFRKIFDTEAYLATNKDLSKAVEEGSLDPEEYFFRYGFNEVRNGQRAIHPGIPVMNESEYLASNYDVLQLLQKNLYASPFEHFLLEGYREFLEGKRSAEGNGGRFYRYIEPKITMEIEREIDSFVKKPLISIIMPVYNVDPKWLDLAIASIGRQWYENWELCIADDASTKRETVDYLRKIDHPRIKTIRLKENGGISKASNEALKLASGEYIALMDNDDELTPDALYEVVKAINEKGAEFIYSDEDKIEMDGTFAEPHFKSDFSPEMFLSQNYLSHLGVIKRSLIERVGGWEVGLEGSQDYDLYLKVLEHSDRICHIPKVLYHWRKVPGSTAAEFSGKSYAQDAGRKALESAMKRRSVEATVLDGKYPGTYKVEYRLEHEPLVSIVIPFKDHPDLLKTCIESILDKTSYSNYEIVGISNNSTEKETFRTMERLSARDERVKFHEYNVPFNYSQINNYAVKNHVRGEHIVLMNNDIEIITSGWIEEMLMFSQRDDVGAVGAKLYYPDDTIQHAGVIIGIGGVAGHSHKYLSRKDYGYFLRPHITQNLSAVTAALLMVKKRLYEEVGGLDEENLKIAFNDVDFCLKLTEKGYNNIYTPWVEAYHYESKSRGEEDTPEKRLRFQREVEFMMKKWNKILEKGDPFYNKNLTLDYEDFSLRIK